MHYIRAKTRHDDEITKDGEGRNYVLYSFWNKENSQKYRGPFIVRNHSLIMVVVLVVMMAFSSLATALMSPLKWLTELKTPSS